MRASTRERTRPSRSPPTPRGHRSPTARPLPKRRLAPGSRYVPFPAWLDVTYTRTRSSATALRTPGRVPAGCPVGTPTSLEKPGDGPSIQSGKGGQFDDIHPPLPRLALRHERLPLAEAPPNLRLGQPRLTARLAQAGEEAAVGRRVRRHGGRRRTLHAALRVSQNRILSAQPPSRTRGNSRPLQALRGMTVLRRKSDMSPPRWRTVAGWPILLGGWLLVKAPYDERRRDFVADAPVSRWQQLSAYDTAEDCEWHRMNDTMVPKRPGVQFAPSEINEIRGKLLRCVPTESVYNHRAVEPRTDA